MRIFIGLVVLALAVPASAALINGSFEDGLNGWTCTNVMNDPSTYIPDPANLHGDHRAGDSNCNSRDSSGSQTAICEPPMEPTWNCVLTGGLAGGGPSGEYGVRITGPCGTDSVTWPGGVFNWSLFELTLIECCMSEVTVEFWEVGNGAWGPAGFHIDALVLECVPEPGSLFLIGLAGLPLLRRRR
jgi:hypothetical protein